MDAKQKVFISQPMNGKTEQEIQEVREQIVTKLLSLGYISKSTEVIDNYIRESAPIDGNKGAWYLAKSLEFLSQANVAVFPQGWEKARGCRLEFECAREYNINILLLH